MAQFGRTWWGQRFLAALERITDPGRLARGRTYARGKRVLSYELQGNTVTARVRGSINPYYGVFEEPIYTTTVVMTPIASQDWQRVIAELSSRAGFVTRLLMNEMPDSIDQVFADAGLHLLPYQRDDFVTQCSCPDWSNPCKHIAGVYYLLAADLDADPFVLFQLRGLSRQELRAHLAESPLGRILAAEMEERETVVEEAPSYYTTPRKAPAAPVSHLEFWTGARRLPATFDVAQPPAVSGLLIKRQGDYPAFWSKDASFITTMEEIYQRVRTKSSELK